MSARDGKFTPATLEFLERFEAKLDGMSPEAIAARVGSLVAEHEDWRASFVMWSSMANPPIGLPATWRPFSGIFIASTTASTTERG